MSNVRTITYRVDIEGIARNVAYDARLPDAEPQIIAEKFFLRDVRMHVAVKAMLDMAVPDQMIGSVASYMTVFNAYERS